MGHDEAGGRVVALDGVPAEVDTRRQDQAVVAQGAAGGGAHGLFVGVDGAGLVLNELNVVFRLQLGVVVADEVHVIQPTEHGVAEGAGIELLGLLDEGDIQ